MLNMPKVFHKMSLKINVNIDTKNAHIIACKKQECVESIEGDEILKIPQMTPKHLIATKLKLFQKLNMSKIVHIKSL